MARPIIEVKNITKQYSLGERFSYGNFREELTGSFLSLFGGSKKEKNKLLALDDVSFEVNEGDVVGIIGRNGAGKSTLLKILSRITEPTSGEIILRGRVASLLEVGTGFHPELTGRENVFFNGALLGMKRSEIKKKFDDIVAFAEIEKFIDTPVKRYSSGMYVRLAFAVAAHLEPEILVVDEVLAVGDAQFQKKCLGKMGEVAKGGRTVLFVSHNMGAVEQLCASAILLDRGKIAKNSKDVLSVIKDYSYKSDSKEFPCYWENTSGKEFYNDYFQPVKFFFSDERGEVIKKMPVRNDADIWINIEGNVRKKDPALYFGIGVFSETETFLFGSMFFDGHPDRWPTISLGTNILRCRLPKHSLNEGIYKIEIHGTLVNKETFFVPGRDNPKIFMEISGGLSESPMWQRKRLGFFAPVLDWINS